MTKSTTALETPLRQQLDRLAAFEPTDFPVLSLYLDMRPNENGRRTWDVFLRKVLTERQQALKGEARKSFEHDTERIREYLEADVRKSADGLALFACSAADGYFEAVQVDVPLDAHWLFVGSVPHLYPLMRLNDQFPRYAALVADTNSARLYVFGLGARETEREVKNVKTRRTTMGGWSQPRYQRHIENFHLQHMKEVIDVLDRTVRAESLNHIVIACDAVTRPLLMDGTDAQAPDGKGDRRDGAGYQNAGARDTERDAGDPARARRRYGLSTGAADGRCLERERSGGRRARGYAARAADGTGRGAADRRVADRAAPPC